jgi:tRNA acetyltransferase TAN1
MKILESFGDKNSKVNITNLSGIVTCITTLDPFSVIKKIEEKILEEPWSIRYCHRIIPIQETVNTEKQNIVDSVLTHSKIMRTEDSYRITVEKRHSGISTKEIIDAIADKIDNKVSLEKFDWIILVEVLGNKTGISVLKEDDILSAQKLKRSLSE